MSIANNKLTVSHHDNIDYGISINDLASFIGSGYHDLLAIMCDYRGIQKDLYHPDISTPAYDAPDEILKDGVVVLRSAFALSDIAADGTRSDIIPLPAGCTLNTRSAGLRSYEAGDLIFGCKPKWNIWGDGINVGKTVINDVFRYNILHNPWRFGNPFPSNTDIPGYWPTGYTAPTGNRAGDQMPDLLAFQNYANQGHNPFLELDDTIPSEWHNGVPVKCDDNNTINCYAQATKDSFGYIAMYEEYFHYDESALVSNAVARMALGNLIDWWASKEMSYRNFNEKGICGMSAEASLSENGVSVRVAVATATNADDVILAYDATSEVKDKFRDGKGSDGELIEYPFSMLGASLAYVWNRMVSGKYPTSGNVAEFSGNKLGLTAGLNLVDTEKDLIPLTDVFKNKSIELQSDIDITHVPTSSVKRDHYLTSRFRLLLTNEVSRVGSYYYYAPGFELDGAFYHCWPVRVGSLFEEVPGSGNYSMDFVFVLYRNAARIFWNDFPETLYALWDITQVNPSNGSITSRRKEIIEVDTDGTVGGAIYGPNNSTSLYNTERLSAGRFDNISYATTAKLTILPESLISVLFLDTLNTTYKPEWDMFQIATVYGNKYTLYFLDYDLADNTRYALVMEKINNSWVPQQFWPSDLDIYIEDKITGDNDTIIGSDIRSAQMSRYLVRCTIGTKTCTMRLNYGEMGMISPLTNSYAMLPVTKMTFYGGTGMYGMDFNF